MQKDALAGDDVAQLLGVTTRTLRNWRRERRGPKCEIVGLQACYPITSLIPWLKKYRRDIDLEPEAQLRYRQAKKAEQQIAEHDPWAEFLPDSPENQRRDREHAAYGEACRLDAEGKYDEADRVLREAGVSAALVEQRRKHVTWRLAHGKGVEG